MKKGREDSVTNVSCFAAINSQAISMQIYSCHAVVVLSLYYKQVQHCSCMLKF